MKKKSDIPKKKMATRSVAPSTGSEEIPSGATTRAADRPRNPGGGGPGSGAGPRHAAGDDESPVEEYGATDTNEPLADPTLEDENTPDQEAPPYGGISGGAVGGTPAEGRSKGGHSSHGFAPDRSRPDTTIGSDPDRRSR
jgi:hypothetical protein